MGTGKTYSTKYLLDSNNNSGVAGQVLSTTSTGIDWVDANTVPGTGLWLASGNDIYNSNSADVVIGGTSSNYKFGVTGGHIGVSNGGNIYIGGFGADAVIGYLGNTSGVFTLRSDGNRDISIGSGSSVPSVLTLSFFISKRFCWLVNPGIGDLGISKPAGSLTTLSIGSKPTFFVVLSNCALSEKLNKSRNTQIYNFINTFLFLT